MIYSENLETAAKIKISEYYNTIDDFKPLIFALLFSLKTDLSVCSFYGTICSGMPAVLGLVGASFPAGKSLLLWV